MNICVMVMKIVMTIPMRAQILVQVRRNILINITRACIAHLPFGKEVLEREFCNESANQKHFFSGCHVFVPLR